MLEPLGLSSADFSVEQIEAMSNCVGSHTKDIEKRVGKGVTAMFSEVETILHKDVAHSGTVYTVITEGYRQCCYYCLLFLLC